MGEIPKTNQAVDPRVDSAKKMKVKVGEVIGDRINAELATNGEETAKGLDELNATFGVLSQLPYLRPGVMTNNTDGVVHASKFRHLIDEWIDSFTDGDVGYDYAKYFQLKEFPGLGDELLTVYLNVSYDERTGIVSMDIAFKMPNENFRSYHLDQLINLDSPGESADGFRKLRKLAFSSEKAWRLSQVEEDEAEDEIEPLALN
jgi:hypothetical protein